MNLTIKISTIITKILSIAFILKTIAVLLDQQQLETHRVDAVLHLGTYVSYIANILFFVSGFLGLKYEGKFYPKYVRSFFWLILFWIIFVYLRSGASIFDPSTFMSVKGIGPYLGMSIMFTANPIRFHKMTKVFLLIGLILVIGGLYNSLKLGMGFDRKTAQMQLLLIAANLIWISPLVLFFNFKKHKVLAITIFATSFIFSVLIVTRSFMVLHVLVLLFFMRYVLKIKLIGLIITIVVAIVSINFLPNIGVIQHAASLLNGRMGNDTRSLQIFLFLESVEFKDFIFGSGVFSYWRMGNKDYQWLDNQILLTAWWAGIVPIYCYLSLLMKSIIKHLLKRNVDPTNKSKAFILFLWVLALSGLSIFISISSSLYHFAIMFVLGSLLFNQRIVLHEVK